MIDFDAGTPWWVVVTRPDRVGLLDELAWRYRLAGQGDGFDVYEATHHAAVRCPECGATVMFEMPRSGEPPTRLNLQVAHDPMAGNPHRARHVVELSMHAFSGRPLLAWRTFARTRVELVDAS